MSMKVENSMEAVVREFLDELLEKYPNVCKCEKCKLDITAFALNRLPPKYTTTNLGQVYTKSSILDSQYRADIISAVALGIKSVKNNPRHSIPKE